MDKEFMRALVYAYKKMVKSIDKISNRKNNKEYIGLWFAKEQKAFSLLHHSINIFYFPDDCKNCPDKDLYIPFQEIYKIKKNEDIDFNKYNDFFSHKYTKFLNNTLIPLINHIKENNIYAYFEDYNNDPAYKTNNSILFRKGLLSVGGLLTYLMEQEYESKVLELIPEATHESSDIWMRYWKIKIKKYIDMFRTHYLHIISVK